MKKEMQRKVKGEVLTREELHILRAGGSPWPLTTAPKRQENIPKEESKKPIAV